MSQSNYSTNTLSDIFLWWYSDFSKTLIAIIRYYYIKLWDNFSVLQLSKSMFAPWKQDEYSTKNVPGGQIFRIWVMNIMSRFIGFIMRSCVMFVAFLSIGLLSLVAVIVIVAYYLAPAILLGLFINGILLFFVK